MLETLLYGIAASLFTEVVTWVDKKLSGTVFKGDGAFLLSFVIAFVAAAIKIAMSGVAIIDLPTLWATLTQVFAISQVWFVFIYTKFGGPTVSSTSETK